MREAIISDVHGNLEALKAVFEDITHQNVDRVVCLGDVVGYGPDPNECMRMVMDRCAFTLVGNHEDAVLHGAEGFNPLAEEAMKWTRDQVRDKDILRFLAAQQSAKLEGNRLYVHGSVKDSLVDYVREAESYVSFRRLVEEINESFKLFNICFTGHNHRAFLGTKEGSLVPHMGNMRFHVEEEKLYVCVGAVGQPRDEDARACYVVYDGSTVHYHRVPYDVATTAGKIRAYGLPDYLAERLFTGQ
ncbi:MAG: metallophosphoesterase family protein [Planctomycetota bacterium]|jgi:predicted phosphodiesterase